MATPPSLPLRLARIAHSEARGHHAVALRDIRSGELVWFEAPVVSVQPGDHAACLATGTTTPQQSFEWLLTIRLLELGWRADAAREYVAHQISPDEETDEDGPYAAVCEHMAASSMTSPSIHSTSTASPGTSTPPVVTASTSSIPTPIPILSFARPMVTVNDVRTIYHIVVNNALALETPLLRINYGAAFYREASFFNHSCEPTCLSLRIGGNIAIYAIADVQAGEELTHSYMPAPHLLRSAEDRAPFLQFECDCPRCGRETHEENTKYAALTLFEYAKLRLFV